MSGKNSAPNSQCITSHMELLLFWFIQIRWSLVTGIETSWSGSHVRLKMEMKFDKLTILPDISSTSGPPLLDFSLSHCLSQETISLSESIQDSKSEA